MSERISLGDENRAGDFCADEISDSLPAEKPQ